LCNKKFCDRNYFGGYGLDASVIIAAYNRKDLLATCLRCLDAQNHRGSDFEVIVVDDGSTDGSVELAQNWPARYKLRCIAAGHQGPGPARNLGVAEAVGDLVIFLDSDAFASPGFVSEHVKSHREACSPIFVDGPAVNISGEETLKNPPFISWEIRAQAFLDFFGAPFVSVNVSCPRKDFLRVGGFDARFGKAYGYEDTELGVRLRLSGLGNARNRRAYVLHHSDGTPTLESEMKKRRECGSNGALFYEKFPLPEVKKLINWDSMKWDARLTGAGLVRWATPERAAAMKQSGHPLYPVARKILLTHLQAAALRRGLADAGINAEE
jgi:glycosyltransferase involved in cell wall biosynthesis